MFRHALGRLIPPVMCLAMAREAPAAPTYQVMVSAPNRAYACAPVSVEVPTPRTVGMVRVMEVAARQPVPAQIAEEGDHVVVRWIVRDLPQGASRKYRIAVGEPSPTGLGWEAVKLDAETDPQAVEITINDELFTRYVFGGAPKPYCYPVIGPTGVPVTRAYPMETVEGETQDHPHHRSFWFTHGEVNGVDFWAEGPDRGRQVHRELLAREEGPVCGALRAVVDWMTADGKKVCEDERELRVHAVPGVRLLDFTSTIRATDGPVEFGDTKEGSFGLRVASALDVTPGHPEAHITNSEGQRDDETWGKPAAWCDYSGPIDGATVGLSVFDHPDSFRHPTYWHVRTYGLFAANPFGLRHFIGDKEGKGRFTLQPGETVTFRYRLLIHPGTAEEAKVADWYAEYADPPQVQLQ
ncbi:MAG: hypothetical protein FJX74_10890 [Armatimonadetes bacterium]|nr:hypothetical protein [Armatimonadota bacterium]